MADGNFNRNILPYNNYRSGLRAGRSSERARAMKIFEDMVREEHLGKDADETGRLIREFRERLFSEIHTCFSGENTPLGHNKKYVP